MDLAAISSDNNTGGVERARGHIRIHNTRLNIMDPPSSRPPAMAVSVYQATTRVNPSRSHFYTNKTFLLFAVGCLALGLINLNFSSKLLLPSDKNGTNKSVHHDSSTKAVSAGKDRLKFARFGEEYITPPICTEPRGELCLSPPIAEFSSALHEDDTLYSCAGQCSIHSTCFMGTCLCHPGYTGPTCDEKKKRANPWYTADCPNLAADKLLSYNINDTIGGNKNCTGEGPNPCAYLCYSGEEYGSVIIPQQVWQNAQNEEGKLWRAPRFKKRDGDRVNEHFQGFADYKCIPGESLGNVIEFGAGPWTQFRGLLSKRPDVKVDSYTVLDPGADGYIKSVESCAYKTGKLLKFDRNGFHDFPVHVVSDLAGRYSCLNVSHHDCFRKIPLKLKCPCYLNHHTITQKLAFPLKPSLTLSW